MPRKPRQDLRLDLVDAVATGDHVVALRALRDHLARLLKEADPRAAAPLAARLTDVLSQLAAATPDAERNALDDLAARRAVRRAKTAGGEPPARGGDRGPGGR